MNAVSQVLMENVSCPMGCETGDDVVLTGGDRLHGLPGEFTIRKCRSCGLMRTSPRPTPDTIGFYYPSDYGPYTATVVAPKTESETAPTSPIRRVLSRLFRLNTEIVPEIPIGRVLEFGCASGSHLAYMAAKGWQVSGIEFDEEAARRAREAGFDVQASSLERANPPTEPVDLVMAWMVLEHLHEPLVSLERLREWTKPGGWLAISIPNVDSWDFRIFGPENYALHLPNHLYHFTPKTITALLDRAGWRVEKIFHQRILSNYFGSLSNWLEKRGWGGKLATALRAIPGRAGYTNHWLLPVSIPFAMMGQTGRMTVWAQRKDDLA